MPAPQERSGAGHTRSVHFACGLVMIVQTRRVFKSRSMEHLPRLLAVARGDEPADLVLAGGRVVNVFTGEIDQGVDIAIADGWIAGIGSGYAGKERVELNGSY